jgi:hypothetical protein
MEGGRKPVPRWAVGAGVTALSNDRDGASRAGGGERKASTNHEHESPARGKTRPGSPPAAEAVRFFRRSLAYVRFWARASLARIAKRLLVSAARSTGRYRAGTLLFFRRQVSVHEAQCSRGGAALCISERVAVRQFPQNGCRTCVFDASECIHRSVELLGIPTRFSSAWRESRCVHRGGARTGVLIVSMPCGVRNCHTLRPRK